MARSTRIPGDSRTLHPVHRSLARGPARPWPAAPPAASARFERRPPRARGIDVARPPRRIAAPRPRLRLVASNRNPAARRPLPAPRLRLVTARSPRSARAFARPLRVRHVTRPRSGPLLLVMGLAAAGFVALATSVAQMLAGAR